MAERKAHSVRRKRIAELRFYINLVRAFGGAILFTFPMLMTMEMWRLGFYMPTLRLALFMVMVIPMLGLLSYYIGFERNVHWVDLILDPFVAYAVAFVAAALILVLFAVLRPGMSFDEIVGKIALQAVPGSIGALLARSQFGIKDGGDDMKKSTDNYGGGLFLMATGAIFLSFSLASTEEMLLIAFQMSEWHAVGLVAFSLALIHAFISVKQPHGQKSPSFWSVFARVTVVGYAIALLVSLYVLWIFGRTDGTSLEEIVRIVIVTAFPASIGAGAARLIL